MSARRWPVLAWEQADGLWCARLISDDVDLAGVGERAAAAVERVEEAVARAVRAGAWIPGDPPEDPAVIEIAVTQRGVELARGRAWPARESVRLLLPVVACASDGGRLAYAPTLPVSVRLVAGDDLKELITQAVRRRLANLPTARIASYLPPRRWRLEQVAVPAPKARSARRAREDLAPLDRVADPLDVGGERRAWQRDALVQQLAGRLGTGCIAIVGETGCGKSAVLAAAARQAAQRRRDGDGAAVPAYWTTTAQRLIAGMRWLGQWEERLEQVVARLGAIDGVLCVASLADLLAVGGDDEADSVAAFLAPFLRRGDLRLVGECTPQELAAIRRRLPAFADVFTVLTVPPLDGEAALAVVRQAAESAGRRHDIAIEAGVAPEVVSLMRRHLGDAGFPGPAVRFVAGLAEDAARAQAHAVTRGDALAAFTRHSGIPERLLRDDIALPAAELHASIARRLVGQEEAVDAAVDVVLRVKAGLCDPERPLASLLLAGPTGTGKTRLAQLLAEELFGGRGAGRALIRLDLSEYAGPDAADRLLGMGRQPSELIRSLRQQPAAVVLLDEAEKADGSVFDVLLGALDEGRIGDRLGRSTSLRSAVVVLTSNLGADARPLQGFAGGDARGEAVRTAIAQHFRPEFLARLDRVVHYRPLDLAAVRAIAALELEGLAVRAGLTERGLRLAWDDAVLDLLARRGHDPLYGARPLQRVVGELVAAPLARLLVARPELRGAELRLRVAEGTVVVG